MRICTPRAAALAALLAACAPNKPLPVDVVVLAFDADSMAYVPVQVQLKTPTDLVSMEGPAARIVGGATIAVDLNDPAIQKAQTAEELAKAVIKDSGGPVTVSFIDKGGLLVPADFHSLNITTTYYNLERAQALFDDVGKDDPSPLKQATVYYFPEFKQGGEPETDNAYFMPLLGSFLFLPFEKFQEIPFALNAGILGHEYAHALFHKRVLHSDPLQSVLGGWLSMPLATPGANLLASLDEGSADLFGTALTCADGLEKCSPTFFLDSLPPEFVSERRVDQEHCADSLLKNQLLSNAYDAFTGGCGVGCHYVLGAVFSSALWRVSVDAKVTAALGGVTPARLAVLQALWNAQGSAVRSNRTTWSSLVDAAAQDQALFSLEKALDAVVAAATTAQVKTGLCSAFMDRFDLTLDKLPNCPATAQRYGDCSK